MSPLVASLNTILALGTIVMQVGALVLLVSYVRKNPEILLSLARKNALLVTFLVSLTGLVFTLVYSEIFGFVPCGLCWFERIFMYPIVILSGIALLKRDTQIADYILGLAIPGALVALYHHYIQMGGSEFINCPAANADCAKRIIFEFGYITFPLMAFSTFVFIAVFMLIEKRRATHTEI